MKKLVLVLVLLVNFSTSAQTHSDNWKLPIGPMSIENQNSRAPQIIKKLKKVGYSDFKILTIGSVNRDKTSREKYIERSGNRAQLQMANSYISARNAINQSVKDETTSRKVDRLQVNILAKDNEVVKFKLNMFGSLTSKSAKNPIQ